MRLSHARETSTSSSQYPREHWRCGRINTVPWISEVQGFAPRQRHQAYASVDQSAPYQASRTREHCWSVLPAYTKDEYLFCTGIREGWFNDEAFFRWLADELLSLCSFFPASRSVIIMNNASVHCNSRIEELIISHGCQISYLPRWVDDLSLIMSGAIFASLLAGLQPHRTHLQRIKGLGS